MLHAYKPFFLHNWDNYMTIGTLNQYTK